MRRRKISTLMIAMLFIACASLSALSFSTRLIGVTTHPDFWLGVFPSSVRCYLGLDGIELLSGRVTEVGATIATGTIARMLSQDPETGQIISDTSPDYLRGNRYYDVMYAAWKIGIAQGMGWSDLADYDLMTLRFTFDGRWEVALDPLMQVQSRTGYPFRNIPAFANAVPGEVLPGTPDLSGNRHLISTSLDLYGKLSDQLFEVGVLEGLSMEFKLVWAPAFLNFSRSSGGYSEYWKIWLFADYAKNLFQKTDSNGNNLWSFGVSNEFEMRILGGKYIPEYARTMNSHIWWYEPENMTITLKDTIRLNYYGRQFLGDCIPYIYLFMDVNYSGGKLYNYKAEKFTSVWEASAGLHVELQLFGFIHIYYEIGGIFLYTGDNQAYSAGYRSSDTVRITVAFPAEEGADWST